MNDWTLKLLHQYKKHQRVLFLGASNLKTLFQTEIAEITAEHLVLENRIPYDYITAVTSSEEFSIHLETIKLTSQRMQSDGVHPLFSLAELTASVQENRQDERISFASEKSVFLQIVNPYDQETVLIRQVLDLSSSGASIIIAQASKLFEPETYFTEICLLIERQVYQKMEGRVIYQRPFIDKSGKLLYQVGLKFSERRSP